MSYVTSLAGGSRKELSLHFPLESWVGGEPKVCLLGCPRNLGSMVDTWIISPTYKWLVYWGEITHLLY